MFDPKTTCTQECLITTFQEVYFVSESFEEAKEKMRWTTNNTNNKQLFRCAGWKTVRQQALKTLLELLKTLWRAKPCPNRWLKGEPVRNESDFLSFVPPPRQGVCQDDQASVLGVLQPVHAEHRPAQRHPRHRERGAGPAQRPHHRLRRSGQDEHLHGHLKLRPVTSPGKAHWSVSSRLSHLPVNKILPGVLLYFIHDLDADAAMNSGLSGLRISKCLIVDHLKRQQFKTRRAAMLFHFSAVCLNKLPVTFKIMSK